MRSLTDPKHRLAAWASCLMLSGCVTPASQSNDPDAPLFREGTYVRSARATESPDGRSPGLPSAIPQPVIPPGTAGAEMTSAAKAREDSDRPARRGADEPLTRRTTSDVPGKAALNFVDAEIPSVISTLARFLGRNFLLDPRVKGQITLVSHGEVPAGTAYDMLVAALRMRGFTIVDVGRVSRVVPVADAKLQGGPVNARAPGGGVATRTIRLAYENAEALVPVLKPMVAPESSITAHASSNMLVITDYVDNLERLSRIIESIDTPTSLDTDVVKIHHGVAVDIAGLASDLLQTGGNDNRRDIVLLADPRSNNVIIRSSSPSRTRLARDLLAKLDSAQDDPGNLHVVYLRHAQSTYLAGVLRGMLTGDTGTSALGSGDNARAALGAGGMSGGAAATNSSGTPSRTGSTPSGVSSGSSKSGGGSARFGGNGNGGANGGQVAGGGSGSSTAFSAGGVTVQADATANALIIAAPEPMYRSIRRVIDLLDQRRAQVMVESLIVEVTEQDAAQLGIQWMRNNGKFIGGSNFGGGANLNNNAANTIDFLPGGLSLGLIDGTVNLPGVGEILNLNLLARALRTKGSVNILSTPNILTLDNEAASIIVGKTVPFVSGQYITPGGGGSDNPFQTVTREDIGLQLKIRPQISEGGTVKLDIYQEVSSIDDQNSGVAGIVTNKRALDTSVLLDDGQIMVLGGLLEDSVNNVEESVPGLGSIPLLGHLFRYDKRQRVKTNLMVFLRPYVIRDANAGRGLTQDRYNVMRAQQSKAQPDKHLLLPDLPAPILPPMEVPMVGARSSLDLRPAQWDQTRQQPSPEVETRQQMRQRPTQPDAAQEPPVRSRLPSNVGVTGDPTVLYATPDSNKTVLQVADVADQDDAVRIAKRVRISGMPAYIVGGPGGIGYAVRVDASRDARAVDTATGVLRELGYRPEIVVMP
ncbi:type II secretion system secretin GspD [Roseateles amylovorans]|uniref:Type II secretion system secretin GspD n=1 Tax=Roseateles amylovorans TaxID=2978473 RepID=A0ABY6AYS2_9BURK|nr:type II secretion system secretin GspD [Roseateles amylovorans]UXH77428.1 type II secretion system secretin GspD [Roseateles amylovorans]